MKTCAEIQGELARAVRDDLGTDERARLELHLTGCPACAGEYEALRHAWTALDNALDMGPPMSVRESVLAAVRRTPAKTARLRPVRALLGAAAATLASVVIVVVPDPDCRTPLAIACCAAVWGLVYGVAFVGVLARSGTESFRMVASRGLLAGGVGLGLAGVCPMEPGAGLLPVSLASFATESSAALFLLGLLLCGLPATLAVLVLRPAREWRTAFAVASAAIAFALVAPALYLGSSALALSGLFALLAGSALGTLAPPLVELRLRPASAGAA